MKAKFEILGKEIAENRNAILVKNAETHAKINKALEHLKRAERILTSKTKSHV